MMYSRNLKPGSENTQDVADYLSLQQQARAYKTRLLEMQEEFKTAKTVDSLADTKQWLSEYDCLKLEFEEIERAVDKLGLDHKSLKESMTPKDFVALNIVKKAADVKSGKVAKINEKREAISAQQNVGLFAVNAAQQREEKTHSEELAPFGLKL